jgi:hypothetical protein
MELYNFFSFLGLVLGLGALVFVIWLFAKYIDMLNDVADIRSLLEDIKHEIQSLNKDKDN